MKKLFPLSLILLLLFAGCKKPKGDPPILPPAESMTIDFSNFESKKKGDLTAVQKGTENSNWEFAAVAAITWRDILFITLVVPVTSFDRAIDQVPVNIGEKTWQWSYSATVAGTVYKARLTGQILASEVEWKMYITREGSYSDFVWFEGTSALDGNSGQWTLYESNASPVELITIDWQRSGSSVGKVTYTYVKNNQFKNSYIEYGLTANTLNAYYKIHFYNFEAAAFWDVNVEWSTTDHNGRVKSLNYLGDELWHCWNQNLINDVCPQ